MDDFSKSQMIGIGISFLILPIAAVGVRIWAKTLSRKGITLDDYLIFAALVSTQNPRSLAFGAHYYEPIAIACCVTQLVAAIDGKLGQHQTDGPNGQPILDDPNFLIYEKVC